MADIESVAPWPVTLRRSKHEGVARATPVPTEFMGGGPVPPAARVTGIEEHACSDGFIERVKPRYLVVERTHEHAYAELHLQDRRQIGNRRQAKAQPLANLQRILLGLQPHVAGQDAALLRVIADVAQT